MSAILAPIAIEAGKQIVTKFIKGRRMRFCPHCSRKINIRGKRRRT